MKAFSKKIALLMLTLIVALCMGLTACNNGKTNTDGDNHDGDGSGSQNQTTYTVTVTCDENINESALKYILVQLVDANGAVAGESELTNGVAIFTLPKAFYSVNLVAKLGFEEMIAEYRWSLANVTPSSPTATVKIVSADEEDSNDKVTYTLTVLLPNGMPVSGIWAQLCGGPDNMCNPKETDENGVAVFTLDAGVYEVHIAKSYWPNGYIFDDNEYTMRAENNELTVYFKAA